MKAALFNLGDLNAPGPDGFSSIFFQKHWEIAGDSIFKAVKRFFEGKFIHKELNETNIVLIPKINSPESLSHFQISLCNFFYKIISKTLANRLKPWMDEVISPFQSAFVLNRQIQDSILVAHEANDLWVTRSPPPSL